MNDFALFLGKFLRHGTSIASVAPSSRWLSQTTVRNVDWEKARSLVEVGAGTGPITRVIARNAAPDCRVIVVERDPDFARLLRERFQEMSNFDIVEGDVRDLAEILGGRGIDQVDHVISGLPVPSLPRATQQALFQAVGKVLRSDGTYQSDYRDTAALLAVLPSVFPRRAICVRAAKSAAGGGVFLQGNQAGGSAGRQLKD